MNQSKFEELCIDAAAALRSSASGLHLDGRFLIDEVEVALVFDDTEDESTLHCYVDLGCPSVGDRAEIHEQLLRLNIMRRQPESCYAIDGGGRAIFCTSLLDADELDGNYVAYVMNFYVEQTSSLRQFVAGLPYCSCTSNLRVEMQPSVTSLA